MEPCKVHVLFYKEQNNTKTIWFSKREIYWTCILKMLEKKEKTCCILINHEILLIKLEYYGVRVIAYELMNSYLNEWLQCVKISQTVLDFKKSVLGPFCFWYTLIMTYTNQIQLQHFTFLQMILHFFVQIRTSIN